MQGDEQMQRIMHFFSSQNTDFDATMAFDGRSHACRKELERNAFVERQPGGGGRRR